MAFAVWLVSAVIALRMPPVTDPEDAPRMVARSRMFMTLGSMSARTVDSSPRTRIMS